MGISIFMVYDSTVLFFYLRRAFSWSLQKFTIYQAISQALWIIGTFFTVHVLHKLVDIPETVLLLVGFLSLLDAYLLYGLASRSWHIYAGKKLKQRSRRLINRSNSSFSWSCKNVRRWCEPFSTYFII